MASGYSGASPDYSRTITEGSVQVVYGNKVPERKYLKAICGNNREWSARLEVHEDSKSASKEGLMILKILFIDIKDINHTEERQKEVITIRLLGDKKSFLFYADSQQSTMKWYRYCSLLFKIPKCDIPEIPKESVAIKQMEISQYSDLHKYDKANKWVVNILKEGIGSKIKLFKLCVIGVCNSSSTFNLYDFYNGKNVLSWHRSGIRLSGCIDSLVFLEADETCHGGPGLLWMEYPILQSVMLQKHIHDFLSTNREEHETPSPIGYVFVDLVVNNVHDKDDTNQALSQIPYKDQLSDTFLPVNTTISRSSTSLSSANSQCSSGYGTENSCTGGYISSEQSFPEDVYKVLPDEEKKQDTVTHEHFSTPLIDSLSIQTTPKIRDDQLIHSSSSPKEFIPANSCKYKLLQSKLKKPSVPKTYKKSTSGTMIPKLQSSSRCTHKSMYATSSRCHTTAAACPSTVQDSKLALQNSDCSSLKLETIVTTSTLQHQLEKVAFQKCSVAIVDKLDVLTILPHLNSNGLLSQNDLEMLLNIAFTTVQKAHHLLVALPRKQKFFEKFKLCLHQTKDGTGHGEILEALSECYNEEVRKANSHNDASVACKHHSKK